jgi:predicted GNAT family N-acyltransferase
MATLDYRFVTGEDELKAALEVRRQVFVEEQDIAPELELDGKDGEALHMVVVSEDRVIGTARVMFADGRQAKIERMAVLKSHRRQGIGKGIVSFLLKELNRRLIKQAVLHAQLPVAAFYRSCGFVETGSAFVEAGIEHIKMIKQL